MIRKMGPLYTLPGDIKVIGEYERETRVYCYIDENRVLFPTIAVNRYGRQTVQRARVVMTAKLGRPLASNEIVHHRDENGFNDDPDNLELQTPLEHNRHHKLGSKHTEQTKFLIAQGLKEAYVLGKRLRLRPGERHADFNF